jgi:hypothetical protein
VIYDQDARDPYLSRYYLLGGPRMPDDSAPFDRYGNPRRGVDWSASDRLGFGLYLHRFHRGDRDLELHSHPWRWAVSWILVGGYREERRIGNVVVIRDYPAWSWNFLESDDYHRVDLLEGECWTLFFAGPKAKSWGFWDRITGKITPWRDFVSGKRDATAHERENRWDITPEQRRQHELETAFRDVNREPVTRFRGFR